jgi:hypothetical protein
MLLALKAGAFFRTLTLWLAVPAVMFAGAYVWVLPKLQQQHDRVKAADDEAIGPTTKTHDSGKGNYVPPTVKVTTTQAREINSNIRISSSSSGTRRRRAKPKPKVETAPGSPVVAPSEKSAPTPPTTDGGGSSPPPETIPVKSGDGGE